MSWNSPRVALVIGVNDYGRKSGLKPLANPVKDADAFYLRLINVGGFKEDLCEACYNPRYMDLRAALRRFKKRVEENKDCVAVLYYAGHGVVDGGKHYMAPKDRDVEDPWNYYPAVALEGEDGVLSTMKSAHAPLLLFDACRTELNKGYFSGEECVGDWGNLLAYYSCGLGETAADASRFAVAAREELFRWRTSVVDAMSHVAKKVKGDGTGVKKQAPRAHGADLSIWNNVFLAKNIPQALREFKEKVAERLEDNLRRISGNIVVNRKVIVPLDLVDDKGFKVLLEKDFKMRDMDFDMLPYKTSTKPVSLDEIVSGKKIFRDGVNFIVGPAGAGKTTLLHLLAMLIASADGEVVPILVNAQKLSPSKLEDIETDPGKMLKYLVWWKERDEQLKLIGGSITPMLLVDGLDEVVDRDELLDGIINLRHNRVIVSSRPGAFQGLRDDVRLCIKDIVRVMPLDAERSAEVVNNALEDIEDEALVDRVMTLAQSTFYGSPLLISFLCRLATDGTVPESVVDLYEGMIQLLLDRGRKTRNKHFAPWDRKKVEKLSCLVAYVMHLLGYEQRHEAVNQSQVDNMLSTIFGSPCGMEWINGVFGPTVSTDALLEGAMESFGGLLSRQSEQYYMMVHRTLQEFLAAKFLTGNGYEEDQRLERMRVWIAKASRYAPFTWSDEGFITSDWWTEVYRFAGLLQGPYWLGERMLGEGRNVEDWLSGIECHGLDRQDVGCRRLWHFIRACYCGASTRSEQLDRVLLAMLKTYPELVVASPGLVEAAAKNDAVVQKLLAMVGDDSADMRWRAVETLGRMGEAVARNNAAVQKLVALLRDCSADVRRRAVEALGGMGKAVARNNAIVNDLVALLGDDSADVRSRTAEALGKMGEALAKNNAAVQKLVAVLGDASADVRSRAVEVLGGMGEAVAKNDAAVQKLLALLGDGSAHVRRMAAEVLGSMGEALRIDVILNGLVVMLLDVSADVRSRAAEAWRAAWVLGRMGEGVARNSAAVQKLVAMLGDDSADMRKTAAEALGGIGEAVARDDVIINGLVARLGHDSADMRKTAAEALGRMGEAVARNDVILNGLVAMLGDKSADVTETAAEALGRMGKAVAENGAAVEKLVEMLGDDSADVRGRVAKALGRMGKAVAKNDAAVQKLVEMLGDASADVRGRVAEALRRMGKAVAKNDAAVQKLVELLGDGSEDVRWNAAEVLGRMGKGAAKNDAAVQKLVAMLEDDSEHVRESAAWSLGRMGKAVAKSDAAVQKLVELLGDDSAEDVRWFAAEVLGGMGEGVAKNDAAVQKLVEILRDASTDVRGRVAEALGRMGKAVAKNDAAVQKLVELLGDDSEDVRWMAVEVLGRLGVGVAKNDDAVQKLVAMLEDNSGHVRESAAWSLGRMGEALAKNNAAVQKLIAMLGNASADLRSKAVKVLGGMGKAVAKNDDAVQKLVAMLGDDSASMRWRVAETLGRMGEEVARSNAAAQKLVAMLGNDSADMRWRAVEALGRMGKAVARNDAIVVCLVALLGDKSADVRWRAAAALSEMGEGLAKNDAAVQKLVAMLGDASAEVRLRTTEAFSLGRMGEAVVRNDVVVNRFVAMLGDNSAAVRSRAVEVLYMMIGKVAENYAVVNGLVAMLRDHSADMRHMAARTLGRVGEAVAKNEGAVKGLVAMLGDDSADMRWQAAAALGRVTSRSSCLLRLPDIV